MGARACPLPQGRRRRLSRKTRFARSESSHLAVDHYDQAEMPLRAQILRYRLGEIQSDPETRTLRDDAEQWINGQGIVSPRAGPACMRRAS